MGRTQSAVSMQVKRLEELVGKPLLVREGRSNTLTADGQMLLDYARRMIQLNDEAMTVFTRPEVSGHVRFGTPDDYADRILPDVLARFARTNCKVQVDVDCGTSKGMLEKMKNGDLDLALREQTGLSISVADESLNCVALGTGKALEYEKQLRHAIDYDS